MSRRLRSTGAVLTLILVLLTGCHPQQPFYLFEDGDLSHYVDKATQIEYPDAQTTSLADVENAAPPLTIENPIPKEFWNVTLEDCVKMALDNSKVMRSLGGRYASSAQTQRAQTGEPPDALITSPDTSRSVYDPAITETTPFTGTEYALSAFDTVLASSVTWQRNDRPQNVREGLATAIFNPVFQENNANFQASLSKTNATGGTMTFSNTTFYDQTNTPTWQVPSTYAVTYQAAFNQPLMQGAGVMYNRIAGPYNPFTPSATGLNTPAFDGVMLARINVDISLADFEGGVRNLVYDVENSYWELYFAYRALEATKTGRDSALQTWEKIHALFTVGARGGEAEKEAQAKAQYYLFRGQVQTSLNDLFRSENRLRYVIGLGVADGRLIRPADEPTTAEVHFDWRDIHSEAIARSVELRRAKWRIKERELEIIAAKNLLQPRLDASGQYNYYGLGDQLIGGANPAGGNGQLAYPYNLVGSNAYRSLFSGQFQQYQLGLNFQMTLGFRAALSTLRYYQLNLAREKARLQDEELEVSHQMGDAVRNMQYNYNLAQTNFNRRVATEKQVAAVLAAFQADTVTLDLLLDAQRQRADAEVAYFRTLTDYQRGIAQVHYRKGSILEYDGVYLAEGPWPAKAQFDAHRLARQRDASHYLDYGFTRPNVISRGAYLQNSRDFDNRTDMVPPGSVENMLNMEDGTANPATEQVPTPATAPPGSNSSAANVDAASSGEGGSSLAAAGATAVATAAATAGTAKPAAATTAAGSPANAAGTAARSVASGGRSNQDIAGVGKRTAKASGGKSSAAINDDAVSPAAYHDWKPSGQHEPDADQSAGATNQSAAGWQGTKR
ncbi:MAG TPA: TolC family protein [Pirellulales bacterium]|jgi:outer membrane protein TolC|nr:TolC family protein [Pirellulales bacterium]